MLPYSSHEILSFIILFLFFKFCIITSIIFFKSVNELKEKSFLFKDLQLYNKLHIFLSNSINLLLFILYSFWSIFFILENNSSSSCCEIDINFLKSDVSTISVIK